MQEKEELSKYGVDIKRDKLGNSLKKLNSGKSDFKVKGIKSHEPASLFICLKSYKVGTFDQLTKFCSQPKNKKHSIILNPIKETLFCIKTQTDINEILKKFENDQKVSKHKFYKKLKDMSSKVNDFVYQWKARLKIKTENDLNEEINPIAAKHEKMKVKSYGKGKKVNLKPRTIFGLGNIGNTCFFNSTIQCLNANRGLVAYYIENEELWQANGYLMAYKNINYRFAMLLQRGREGKKNSVSPKDLFKSVIAM
jgi:ubiquitin carboxyl-terminal hydrolase 16/45